MWTWLKWFNWIVEQSLIFRKILAFSYSGVRHESQGSMPIWVSFSTRMSFSHHFWKSAGLTNRPTLKWLHVDIPCYILMYFFLLRKQLILYVMCTSELQCIPATHNMSLSNFTFTCCAMLPRPIPRWLDSIRLTILSRHSRNFYSR